MEIKNKLPASEKSMGVKSKALTVIAKGAGFLFLNTFILYIIRFIFRLVTSRYLGPVDYGLLSLGLMIMGVFGLLATVGLNNGVVKFISHYLGKKDFARVRGTVSLSFATSLFVSICVSVILIIFRNVIAQKIFHTAEFAPLLVVFALSIPLVTSFKLIGKSFMGFKRPEFTIITSTFGRELLLLLLVLGVVYTGGTLLEISLMYLISTIIALVFSYVIFSKLFFSPISDFFRFRSYFDKNNKVKFKGKYNLRELLSYSFPLFFSAVFIDVMGYADTFFLGFFMSVTDVGIYNVALPLASSLGIFLTSFSRIFFPVLSEMKAQNKFLEMGNIFAIITRWGFFMSLPVFLFIALFSKEIIVAFFGEAYSSGAVILVILSIAYFVDILVGPAVEVLKALGEVKKILWINSGSAILNVILNIMLIPFYGIIGAAIATTFSFATRELLLLFHVRKHLSFSFHLKKYVKYLFCAGIPLGVMVGISSSSNFNLTLIPLIISSIIYMAVYLFLVLLVGGLSHDDKYIIEQFEKKTKVSLRFLKKYSK